MERLQFEVELAADEDPKNNIIIIKSITKEDGTTYLIPPGFQAEHLKHLSKLLDAIAEEGFRLKLTKCKFAAQSVRFLGHIVEGNTITPLKDNLRSIAEFPAPQNKKQIRQFLDHKPLENLNIKNRTDDELGDMTHYLSQYNFVIKYNPGKCNTEADCLSRNPVYESHENEEDKLKTVNIGRDRKSANTSEQAGALTQYRAPEQNHFPG
ncbi:hypothetical protein EVAR_30968_1 [Eumeta japonica]|uniref:Uncharacterized protein n=1 Tax=Eumeta variegata TaxID=151549 RepID=A0A4C1W6D3_EUMVA|nr:hypothetical protein EVAR_30968_1 [Eumeta japonica]